MRLEDIDRNFKLDTVQQEDIEWISALDERFSLSGIYFGEAEDRFIRMPLDVAAQVSGGVHVLADKSTGGRLRFETDSPYVAVRSVVIATGNSPHMTNILRYGYSLYVDNCFLGMFAPAVDDIVARGDVAYEGIRRFSAKSHDVALYFPLYGTVRALFIGVKKGSTIKKAKPYKNEGAPVVFYGSSITMGGCACRPGTDYVSMVCRDLNIDYINLGFSGNAKAEIRLADYFASLPMSVFVYDYDHNAPTPEYLAETHEPFFMRLRELRPDLPVIMVSRPDYTAAAEPRLVTIRTTYERALARGDKNVFFVDGSKFFSKNQRAYATVDGCHPNDLGFYLMARKMKPVIVQALRAYKKHK